MESELKSERQKKVTPAAKKAPAARRPQPKPAGQPLRAGDVVFVTRHALITGITQRTVVRSLPQGEVLCSGTAGILKPGCDYARAPEEAIKIATDKRDAEVARLRRRIEQLLSMKFEVRA